MLVAPGGVKRNPGKQMNNDHRPREMHHQGCADFRTERRKLEGNRCNACFSNHEEHEGLTTKNTK